MARTVAAETKIVEACTNGTILHRNAPRNQLLLIKTTKVNGMQKTLKIISDRVKLMTRTLREDLKENKKKAYNYSYYKEFLQAKIYFMLKKIVIQKTREEN